MLCEVGVWEHGEPARWRGQDLACARRRAGTIPARLVAAWWRCTCGGIRRAGGVYGGPPWLWHLCQVTNVWELGVPLLVMCSTSKRVYKV